MVALSLVASFSKTGVGFSGPISLFLPTVISRTRMALRVTAGVTCIGAGARSADSLSQSFAVSLKGLPSSRALRLRKGITFCSVTCNGERPLRATEHASEAIGHKITNRQLDRVQVFPLVRREVPLSDQALQFSSPDVHLDATKAITTATPIRSHPLGRRLSLSGRLDRLGFRCHFLVSIFH
jgi:hypothetical protein